MDTAKIKELINAIDTMLAKAYDPKPPYVTQYSHIKLLERIREELHNEMDNGPQDIQPCNTDPISVSSDSVGDRDKVG